LQVPPDFYIPDFDEDELDPDERVDRKCYGLTTEDGLAERPRIAALPRELS